MNSHTLSPDSQAILLLCGSFGKQTSDQKPLSVTEYSQLAQWLHQSNMRPADLLTASGESAIQTYHYRRVNAERLQGLLHRTGPLAFAVEHWTNTGIWIITRSDSNYPKRLKTTLKHLAPPILYGAGNIDLLSGGGLGVVGSRHIDEQAIRFTQNIAKHCATAGIQIVSGGAKGVDSESMMAALETGGSAVGVLANGLAQATRSAKFRSYVTGQNLVLISPYHPDSGFTVGNAMGRNKYIYALSQVCLVVSSDMKGGTWSGANENLKAGWVPLLVRQEDNVPRGNHKLIELGGIPVTVEMLKQTFSSEDWAPAFESMVKRPEPVSAQASLFDPPPNSPQSIKTLEPNNQALAAQESSGNMVLEIDDMFEIVWPYLQTMLRQPCSPDELAEKFALNKRQTKEWLDKAEQQGHVVKLKRPVRYQLQTWVGVVPS